MEGPPIRHDEPRDWRVIALAAAGAILALALVFGAIRWASPRVRRWSAAWRGSEYHAWRQLRRTVAKRNHAALRPALDTWAARVEGADPRHDPGIQNALLSLGAHGTVAGPPTPTPAPPGLAGLGRRAAQRAPLGPPGEDDQFAASAQPCLLMWPVQFMKIDMRLAVMSLLAGAIVAAVPVLGQQTSRTTGYVGSSACKTCHAAEAQAWSGSDHGLAWTMPTPEHIRADFDGTSFKHDGMTARFSIAPDDSRHISVTEANGATTDYKVHSVAGIEPLQQYLLETEPGRLQSFDVAWDTERKRWFHLYPDQHLPPDDGLHWTGSYKTWNSRCAECHATGYRKNYDPETRRYASTQAEIGVGCEFLPWPRR